MGEEQETSATEETQETSTEETQSNASTDTESQETLGDAGKKAIQAERQARKAAEDRAKQFEARLKEIEDKEKSEAEKATERAAELQKQIEEMTKQRQDTALRLAVITEAGRHKITGQPAEDAVALIDRDALEFDDNGTPTNVSQVFEALIKARPYLKGQSHGSADQGARGGTAQLTQDDLKKMTPEQIVAAKNEGRLDRVLGVT